MTDEDKIAVFRTLDRLHEQGPAGETGPRVLLGLLGLLAQRVLPASVSPVRRGLKALRVLRVQSAHYPRNDCDVVREHCSRGLVNLQGASELSNLHAHLDTVPNYTPGQTPDLSCIPAGRGQPPLISGNELTNKREPETNKYHAYRRSSPPPRTVTTGTRLLGRSMEVGATVGFGPIRTVPLETVCRRSLALHNRW